MPIPGQIVAGTSYAGTASGSATTALTVANVAAKAGDFIAVFAYSESATNGPAVTSISYGGYTFTRRARTHGTTRGNLEFWYAFATSLTNGSLVITYPTGMDDSAAVVIPISGVNSSTPFDTGASFPATLDFAVTTAPSFTVSNATAGSFPLFAVATASNWTARPGTPPFPFSVLGAANNGAGSLFAFMAVGGGLTFGPVASAGTYAWSSVTDGNNSGEAIFDALAPATAWTATSFAAGAQAREALLIGTNPKILEGALVREALYAPIGRLRQGALVREVLLAGGASAVVASSPNVCVIT